MVGAIGVEPTTPTVSRWCSTAELTAREGGELSMRRTQHASDFPSF